MSKHRSDTPTYRIKTLGCRVNHAEARELETVLGSHGLRPAGDADPPDLVVVHTCSVTSSAVRKSRHAVRRAQRGRPAQVFVTGCYAGTDAEEARNFVSRDDDVIPHHSGDGTTMVERFSRRLGAWLEQRHANQPLRRGCASSSTGGGLRLPVATPAAAGRHIRAELKIQDGCDAHCTFCIIPRIRRQLRSKTIPDAVEEAKKLVDLGHPEIVLTGIFIGAYGHETALRRKQTDPHRERLADLLDAVARVPGLKRLRISSMEPGDVTEALLDAMVANAPVVVPHLHLPLQSGSDRILRRMNRQYRVGDYLDMIDMVEQALTTADGLPPAITTDIICGFPGETDEDFEQTASVAERVGYLHMHVFPFSPRAGTAAARWIDQFVPQNIARARVRRLIDLEEDAENGLSIRFRRRLLGRTVRVILEQPDRGDPAWMTGRCDHYALVHVNTDRPRGTLLHASIAEVDASRTMGEAASTALPLTVLNAK